MILKIRGTRDTPNTITATWFVGEDKKTMQNMGQLRFRVGEWQLIIATLLLGARQVQGAMTVEVNDPLSK